MSSWGEPICRECTSGL